MKIQKSCEEETQKQWFEVNTPQLTCPLLALKTFFFFFSDIFQVVVCKCYLKYDHL